MFIGELKLNISTDQLIHDLLKVLHGVKNTSLRIAQSVMYLVLTSKIFHLPSCLLNSNEVSFFDQCEQTSHVRNNYNLYWTLGEVKTFRTMF